MTFLDELYADLLADDAERPRSQQVEIGGSGLFGCRAEHVLRLNGVPQSDPRLSWEAFVGSAVDHRIGEARLRRHPELIVQEQLPYRGVKFTVDEFSPSESILRDWKTKNNAAACVEAVAMMVENRPGHEQKRAQLHGGAAALRQAGHDVQEIQLVFLPRAGAWDGTRLFTEPFSQEWADKGVEWAHGVHEIVRTAPSNGVDIIGQLRDKPPMFCHAYCPYVTICRGEGEPDTAEVDPELIDAAQRYITAKADFDAAEARKDYYRDLLRGAPPIVTDGWKVAWSRDTREAELVPDFDGFDVEAWEFITGQPFPRKSAFRGKAPSLTPRKVRDK